MTDSDSKGAVDRFLAAITGASMTDCDAFSANAVLEATVPNWRFRVDGADAIRSQLAQWYADPGVFEELVRTPLPSGELVEFTLRWEEGGVPHAAHQAHVIETGGGRITRDKVWCGGRWPASLLAEMAEAADARS